MSVKDLKRATGGGSGLLMKHSGVTQANDSNNLPDVVRNAPTDSPNMVKIRSKCTLRSLSYSFVFS